jgi:hypothetical protein
MKKLGLLLLLLALGYVAYPFWTIIRIAHAVKHGDIPTLEAMIDWPKVRDGIKSDVTGPFMKSLGTSKSEGVGGALGTAFGVMLAPTMIDWMLSNFVTAQTLVEGAKEKNFNLENQLQAIRWISGFSFVTPTQMRLHVYNPNKPDEIIPVVMEMSGGSWRVTRVILSPDRLADKLPRPNEQSSLPVQSPATVPIATGQSMSNRTTPRWEITDGKSPVDDSPEVAGRLEAQDAKSALVIRCKEHETRLFITTDLLSWFSDKTIGVLIRINGAPAIAEQWTTSISGNAAFSPSAISRITSLSDNGTLFVRLKFYSLTHDATFSLGNVSEVRDRVSAACKWSTPAPDKLPKPKLSEQSSLPVQPPTMAPAATGQPMSNPEPPRWEITDGKSKVDDSPEVRATLLSQEGTSISNAALLMIRCMERSTDLVVVPNGYLGSTNGNVRTLFRINDAPAIIEQWRGSTDGKAAYSPNAVSRIKSLPENGTLFVRLTAYNGHQHDATFSLGNVSEVRDRVSAACKWPTSAPPAKPPTSAKKADSKPKPKADNKPQPN